MLEPPVHSLQKMMRGEKRSHSEMMKLLLSEQPLFIFTWLNCADTVIGKESDKMVVLVGHTGEFTDFSWFYELKKQKTHL